MSIYLNKKVAEIQLFQHFYHRYSLIKSTKAELKLNNYDRICHIPHFAPLIYDKDFTSLLLEEKVPRRGGCGVAPSGALPQYGFADRFQ